ncbi:hypothetical protein FHR83_008727 [Actinoplanes campanulatus]|uniref:Uncharacterized protein n=1 Tax=Actinoplanes campanulatus TaxID=113559 RepID=A0A7W5ARJ3_9ACTN|nr:hypothetical protein [Actinoplanes campanulatus]MBB3101000.1 hypothetical protein [Actinoplanes campanulatus]GGN49182.1 hypothetical protein GCM10010109_86930 [Actinoplanes campanulatus]GID41818.1 hypothetical protein Aca09nite_83240 [Actinoplanes campanulatus]
MSDHYEVVFSCLLADDVPAEILDVLRWHLGDLDERPALIEDEYTYRLLEPDPDSYLPGGEFAQLVRRRDQWGLYARIWVLDDDMGYPHELFGLLAPHVAETGYGGHIRDVNDHRDLSIIVFDGTGYRWRD